MTDLTSEILQMPPVQARNNNGATQPVPDVVLAFQKRNAKTVPAGYSIDLSAWLMADFEDWQTVTGTGILKDINPWLAKIIKVWPHVDRDGQPLDPTQVESYRKLTLSQWNESVKAVGDAVTATFQQA